MKTLLTAAVLTLSTILSLGSALLLTLTTLGVVNPTLNLYTLFVYLIAASPSYLVMKTLLEILKPQTATQTKSENEPIVERIEQTEQQAPKGEANGAKQQTAEPSKPTQPSQEAKAEEPKNVGKDVEQPKAIAATEAKPSVNEEAKQEATKAATTIEPKPEKPANPQTPQPSSGDKEVSGENVKIFTPLLDELRSIQNELNGLKVRLKKIKENLKPT